MIQRFLSLAGFLALLTLSSCDTEVLNITRDFTGATITLSVPESDGPSSVAVSQNIDDNELQAQMEELDISEDRLKEVAVRSVLATITDPNTSFDFTNLSNAALVFDAPSLGTLTVASLDQGSGTQESFAVSEDDIKAYLLSDSFTVTLTGDNNTAVGPEVTVDLDVTYGITAGL